MVKNYLLTYAEQLATDVELLCQNIKKLVELSAEFEVNFKARIT